jgi:hypothetical protein
LHRLASLFNSSEAGFWKKSVIVPVFAPLKIEQVRKGGLPPLNSPKQQRGQATLPDLFYFLVLISIFGL